jgi:hypothetical protein
MKITPPKKRIDTVRNVFSPANPRNIVHDVSEPPSLANDLFDVT